MIKYQFLTVGTVQTVMLDEVQNRVVFTMTDDDKTYRATMADAEILQSFGSRVRFHWRNDGEERIIDSLRYDGMAMPTEDQLDRALLQAFRQEFVFIAGIGEAPFLVTMKPEQADVIRHCSRLAKELLDDLNAVSSASEDPKPTNSAMAPLYKRAQAIGGKFRNAVMQSKSLQAIAADPVANALLVSKEGIEDLEYVRRAARLHIDGHTIPTARYVPHDALMAAQDA